MHFDSHSGAGDTLMFLTVLLSGQLLFGLLGLKVLQSQNYARTYLAAGGTRSPGSYALVCPGVALSVMIHFFVNKGLVVAGLVDKFSSTYWVLTAAAVALQFLMIALVFHLHKLHFGKLAIPGGLAAEQ
jgi:hypothetical protein